MTNRQKYCIIQDDSCHYYLAPFERKEEAQGVLDSIEEYWNIGDYDKECPQMPDWIVIIDGWHKLTFENPVEE